MSIHTPDIDPESDGVLEAGSSVGAEFVVMNLFCMEAGKGWGNRCRCRVKLISSRIPKSNCASVMQMAACFLHKYSSWTQTLLNEGTAPTLSVYEMSEGTEI